jgi:SPP1 gp7 family putative phage head morphogenesis protein
MSNFSLPLRLEREYEFFRAKIVHDVGRIGTQKLTASHLVRLDAEDDPQLRALAELLGLSSAALLNGNKLRAKLRRFAERLSAEKRLQLSTLLGRWVPEPNPAIIEKWVSEQATAISEEVNGWLSRAAVATGTVGTAGALAFAATNQTATAEAARGAIAFATAVAATRARNAASSALLNLNTQLLGSASTLAGVTSYLWVTAKDERVREWHASLDGTIQKWDDPPMGGGTREDEEGNPGSGWGCRCIAEPVVLPK